MEKGEGLYLEGMIQEVFTDEGAVIEDRKSWEGAKNPGERKPSLQKENHRLKPQSGK